MGEWGAGLGLRHCRHIRHPHIPNNRPVPGPRALQLAFVPQPRTQPIGPLDCFHDRPQVHPGAVFGLILPGKANWSGLEFQGPEVGGVPGVRHWLASPAQPPGPRW